MAVNMYQTIGRIRGYQRGGLGMQKISGCDVETSRLKKGVCGNTYSWAEASG